MAVVQGTGSATGHATVAGAGQYTNPFAALLATRQFAMADLFTITTGPPIATVTITTADKPIYWHNVWFAAYGLRVDGLRFRRSVGLSVDEQTVTLSASSAMTFGGVPWLQAVAAGLLDGAYIKRERVFMADWHSPPVGSLVMFDGVVSSVDSIGSNSCQLKVKSLLNLLNMDMPHNSWQPLCQHTLYNSGCGVARSSYTNNGSVEAGSTASVVQWTNQATAGYFWQGTVHFATGANMGVKRVIKMATGSQLLLTVPLPFIPNVGDVFYAYPGCDKTMSTCQNRFNNLGKFRGYPYVPAPQVAL